MATDPDPLDESASDEELDAALEALAPRLERYMLFIDQAKDPTTTGQEMRQVGGFWKKARQDLGRSRAEVAEQMNMANADLAAFENGMLPFQDLPTEFMPQLSVALGDPTIFDRFISELGWISIKHSDLFNG